jgi:hypothetical protein
MIWSSARLSTVSAASPPTQPTSMPLCCSTCTRFSFKVTVLWIFICVFLYYQTVHGCRCISGRLIVGSGQFCHFYIEKQDVKLAIHQKCPYRPKKFKVSILWNA